MALTALCFGGDVRADEPDPLQPGQPAVRYAQARFVTGPHAAKDRSTLPLARDEAKKTVLAVYVKAADQNAVHLARALDRRVRQFKNDLKWSFLMVSDEQGEVPAGGDNAHDSQASFESSVEELRVWAQEAGVESISIGILDPPESVSRIKSKLGFFKESDVVVAAIEPGFKRRRLPKSQLNKPLLERRMLATRRLVPVYRYVRRLQSAELDAAAAQAAIDEALQSLAE
ncbi:MAG: hypothetical protein AAGJ46_19940 [Planctomycetota bacterium]